MLSRIHVYAASLLVAGPAVALGQSSIAAQPLAYDGRHASVSPSGGRPDAATENNRGTACTESNRDR
jgi:hypothetical protein